MRSEQAERSVRAAEQERIATAQRANRLEREAGEAEASTVSMPPPAG
ncbi:MAG: hypothetical protein ACR2MK_12745 [Solirubrobacteraceae bacterium]